MIEDYSDMLGANPRYLVPDDKVQAMRQARAQQAQQAQQAEQAQQAASAMRDMAASDPTKAFSGYA